MTTLHDWWFGDRFVAPPSVKDSETIEQLRKDLYQAHKMANLWKKAYEELDVAVKELVDNIVAVKPPKEEIK
jgi:hypothetical protein